MPAWVVAIFLAIGVTAWTYAQSARRTGNADPRSTAAMAATVGFIFFLVALSLMKMVLNF